MAQNGIKVFKASTRSGPVGRIPFGIEVVTADGQRQTHKFAAVDQLPAGAQLMMAGYMDDSGQIAVRGIEAVRFVVRFFSMLLPADEYARFDALANDPQVGMEVESLIEIVHWLMEETTGRPTSPSGSSVDGPSTTAPSSTAISSALASTSSLSPSPGS